MTTFTCSRCKLVKPVHTDGGTGYARNAKDELICYACCEIVDRDEMKSTGRAVLYLSQDVGARSPFFVLTNWPGTLRINVSHHKKGRHNIAGTRHDVWFVGPDGRNWHGVNIGDNQICRCKRLAA